MSEIPLYEIGLSKEDPSTELVLSKLGGSLEKAKSVLSEIINGTEELLEEYKKYYDMLWDWLLLEDILEDDPKRDDIQNERNQIIRDIQIRATCISKLLPFEINMVFSDWYGNGFNKTTYLPESLKRHLYLEKMFIKNDEPVLLSVAYPEYFNRIRQS